MNKGARRIIRPVSLQRYAVEREAVPLPGPPLAHLQMVLGGEMQDRMILNLSALVSMMGFSNVR